MTRTRHLPPRPRGRPGPARAGLLSLALITVGATGAAAQAREGQFLGVGLGAGFDQITCEVCIGTPQSGVAGFVRFGGTVSDRLLLGVELDAWTRADGDVRQYMGSLMAIALLYASPETRFHVKLGAGAIGYRASAGGDRLTSLAPGAGAGIGYDYPITETISITPFASLVVAPFSTLSSNGNQAATGATLALLQGGLSLTWH